MCRCTSACVLPAPHLGVHERSGGGARFLRPHDRVPPPPPSLPRSSPPSPADAPESPTRAASAGATAAGLDFGFYQAMGIAKTVPQGTHPAELAAGVLQLMADFTRDMATVNTAMDSFYAYMDERHHWQDPVMQAQLTRVLRSAGAEHQFPVFTSMLRHAGSKQLSAADCAAVVDMAGRLVGGWPVRAPWGRLRGKGVRPLPPASAPHLPACLLPACRADRLLGLASRPGLRPGRRVCAERPGGQPARAAQGVG